MADDKWGTKRICQECVTTFYDMKRPKILCPKCGTLWTHDADSANRSLELMKAAPPQRKRKTPSLEDLEVDKNELRPMNIQQVDELYGDLLDEDFSSEEIKDVSDMFESEHYYND